MSTSRKQIDSAAGRGELQSDQGQPFEVEYQLRTYQEFVDEHPGATGIDGAVMTLDPKPWIPPGELFLLTLENGKVIRVVNKEPFTTEEWCLVDVIKED